MNAAGVTASNAAASMRVNEIRVRDPGGWRDTGSDVGDSFKNVAHVAVLLLMLRDTAEEA
jgi:hypothetical protein